MPLMLMPGPGGLLPYRQIARMGRETSAQRRPARPRSGSSTVEYPDLAQTSHSARLASDQTAQAVSLWLLPPRLHHLEVAH